MVRDRIATKVIAGIGFLSVVSVHSSSGAAVERERERDKAPARACRGSKSDSAREAIKHVYYYYFTNINSQTASMEEVDVVQQ